MKLPAHTYVKSIEHRLREFTGATIYFVSGTLIHTNSVHESERQLMHQAGEKRKREFYSGRHIARQALQQAGIAPAALLRGPLGNPVWPASIIGSITHDHNVGAAMVCGAGEVQGLGLDLIEDPQQVTDDLGKLVLHPDETKLLTTLFPDLPPTGVAFSLKESVVKAVSVYLGRYMDLLEIRLEHRNRALVARVDELPVPLPCLALMTPIGLITCCVFPLESSRKTRQSDLRTS